jgi:hypothetical protein
MTSEQFKTLLQTRPFRPFRIHVADQHVIQVRHPELALLTQGGRTVFVNTEGENVEIVDLLLVTRLSYDAGNGAHPKRPKRNKRQ